jgi:APA family basic amino acid/polyamine antiporter
MNPDQDVHLERKLGPFSAMTIVVANMIGAGIFTTSGLMAAQLPSAGWVIFCWLLGGLIAICGALCYAELATRMPVAGGEYIYLKRLYHPALGFLTGWTSLFVGFSAPIAASAMSFSEYIFAGLDSNLWALNPTQLDLFKKASAIFLILIFTFLHYLGLRLGSRIQNILTILKIGIVFCLGAAGLALGRGDFSHLTLQSTEPFKGIAFGTAMMLVMFSYSGWNASAYIAGELRRPKKTLPVSLILGTAVVIFIYILINIFIFYAVPYSELRGVIPVVEAASVKALGGWMGKTISLLIGFALLSSLSAYLIIGPRVYFAMAKDRLFFPFASKVNPRYRVPGKSIVIQGALAVLMVAIGSFEQLLIYLGFSLGIFPWLAVGGLFIARKKRIGEESAVKLLGFPLIPVFFLASSLILMIFNYFNRPLESTAAVLTVSLGIPFYYLWVRKWEGKGKDKP